MLPDMLLILSYYWLGESYQSIVGLLRKKNQRIFEWMMLPAATKNAILKKKVKEALS